MGVFPRILRPKSRIASVLQQLHCLPLAYSTDVGDDMVAWGMHLTSDTTRHEQGTYSTAFAVQLLCSTRDPSEDQIRRAIIGGMRFLVAQYDDAKAIEAGEHRESKQGRKFQQVQHTDLQLILKSTTILDAANAVSTVRARDPEFGRVINEASSRLDELGARLKEISVQREFRLGGKLHRGWPWHALVTNSQLDIIPTAHVALTLTHPGLAGTNRYLDEILPILNYLSYIVRRRDTALLHRAIGYRVILELCRRANISEQDCVEVVQSIRDTANELLRSVNDIDAYSWQEVLHFPVPAAGPNGNTISHYKPWIWICPKLELAETFLLFEEDGAQRAASRVAAEVVKNVRINEGMAKFLSSQPATLLANLRTAEFLVRYRDMRLATMKGEWGYVESASRVWIARVATEYPWVLLTAFIGLFWSRFAPGTNEIARVVGWNQSRLVMKEVLNIMSAVPLLLLVVLLLTMVFAQGTFVQKLRTGVSVFIGSVFVSLAVNVLTR